MPNEQWTARTKQTESWSSDTKQTETWTSDIKQNEPWTRQYRRELLLRDGVYSLLYRDGAATVLLGY